MHSVSAASKEFRSFYTMMSTTPLFKYCIGGFIPKASFSSSKCICEQASNATKINRLKKTVQKLGSTIQKQAVNRLRNVGIIAHIDAGKTTTTERILYYSGITDDIGNVDEGTTITDYLAQERERGITIQSAAISLHWRQHRLNIIDTPGHIDFTVEVERALRVMDSAVGVLDAAAGVEAQTKTVWRQANKFDIPRLIFLNKMDKQGADVENSLESIRKELKVTPLLTQLNLGVERDFEGVVDLISMSKLRWMRESTSAEIERSELKRCDGSDMYDEAIHLRNSLIDSLADINPHMMDVVLGSSTYDDITAETIKQGLNEVTRSSKAVPVLLGSSLKNCGVQPLLDAIVDYLPSPEQSNIKFSLGKELCAFAFKTIHQKERGPVTFLRLYNGTLTNSSTVYNETKEHNDKIGKLYTILADQMIETKSAQSGDIVAVTGLDKSLTGDTLLTNASAVQRYESGGISLPSLTIPDPVFMCSIESYSTSEHKALDDALNMLTREDPSLRVKTDTETGQMIISGMGELHLEIIKDRLLKEYKLEVTLGKTLVAYRERINRSSGIIHHTLDRTINGTANHVSIALSVEPAQTNSKGAEFVRTREQTWDSLKWYHRKPIDHGVGLALSSGPLLGYPVVDCRVKVHGFTVHASRTSPAMITAAVTEATHLALTNSGVILSEPVMNLQIYCGEDHLGDILSDLAQRRAIIGNINHKEDGVVLQASSPVAMLLGYSTTLRKISSGQAHFMMEIEGYLSMSEEETQKILNEMNHF